MLGNSKSAFDDAEHGIYDCTIKGKCSGCGNCCSNRLPLSQKEIDQIREYIIENDIHEVKRVNNVIAKPTIDLQCPFLNESRQYKCTIYPVRPQICREFMCNLGSSFYPSQEILDGKHHNINVRETFFGKK